MDAEIPFSLDIKLINSFICWIKEFWKWIPKTFIGMDDPWENEKTKIEPIKRANILIFNSPVSHPENGDQEKSHPHNDPEPRFFADFQDIFS